MAGSPYQLQLREPLKREVKKTHCSLLRISIDHNLDDSEKIKRRNSYV